MSLCCITCVSYPNVFRDKTWYSWKTIATVWLNWKQQFQKAHHDDSVHLLSSGLLRCDFLICSDPSIKQPERVCPYVPSHRTTIFLQLFHSHLQMDGAKQSHKKICRGTYLSPTVRACRDLVVNFVQNLPQPPLYTLVWWIGCPSARRITRPCPKFTISDGFVIIIYRVFHQWTRLTLSNVKMVSRPRLCFALKWRKVWFLFCLLDRPLASHFSTLHMSNIPQSLKCVSILFVWQRTLLRVASIQKCHHVITWKIFHEGMVGVFFVVIVWIFDMSANSHMIVNAHPR